MYVFKQKQLVLDAMDNKPTSRVPVGFWFHFLPDEIHTDSFREPQWMDTLFAGQCRYIDEEKPDFVKIMTDGFFSYEIEQHSISKRQKISDGFSRWLMMTRGLRRRLRMQSALQIDMEKM